MHRGKREPRKTRGRSPWRGGADAGVEPLEGGAEAKVEPAEDFILKQLNSGLVADSRVYVPWRMLLLKEEERTSLP